VIQAQKQSVRCTKEYLYKAVSEVRYIFIGTVLVLLDFNLDVGNSRIGLIPDFIGYVYMLMGIKELEGFSKRFLKIAPLTKGMAVYCGLWYTMNLFGVSAAFSHPVTIALEIASTAMSLYISYHIVKGIQDIEDSLDKNLYSHQLYSTWKAIVVVSILAYLMAVVSILTYAMFLIVICVVSGIIVHIYYLYLFYKTLKIMI
jgi:4-hydroxybenzoate polyprenyltransferase